MTSAVHSGEVTSSAVSANHVAWPTVASGQVMPAMPLSMSAVLLGLHVIHGVLGTFQLPTFLQTLSKDKPNGQGDRLFTLPPSIINVDDIKRFTPRKRHLKPKKLLKRLGRDFDSFWMSVDLPGDLLETQVKKKVDTSLGKELHTLNLTSLELALRAKYGSGNSSNDEGGGSGDEDYGAGGGSRSSSNSSIVVGPGMTEGIMSMVQSWLVQKASCPVYYTWEDLGLLYWPRWVRRGMCSPKDTKLSSTSTPSPPPTPTPCSWPPGMHCVPAKAKRLKILRWQCRNNKALNNFNRFRLPGFPDKSSTESSNDRSERSIVTSDLVAPLPKQVNASLYQVLSLTKMIIEQHGMGTNRKDTSTSQTVMEEGKDVVDKDVDSKHDKFPFVTEQEDSKYQRQTLSPIREELGTTVSKTGSEQTTPRRRLRDVLEDDLNDTENWNKMSWKERRRKLNLKCKWIKIPYPVTDDCYCSC